jgi:hypothetical protein
MEYTIELKQLSDISNAVSKLQYINDLLIETNPVLAKEMTNRLEVITNVISQIIEVKNEQH